MQAFNEQPAHESQGRAKRRRGDIIPDSDDDTNADKSSSIKRRKTQTSQLLDNRLPALKPAEAMPKCSACGFSASYNYPKANGAGMEARHQRRFTARQIFERFQQPVGQRSRRHRGMEVRLQEQRGTGRHRKGQKFSISGISAFLSTTFLVIPMRKDI